MDVRRDMLGVGVEEGEVVVHGRFHPPSFGLAAPAPAPDGARLVAGPSRPGQAAPPAGVDDGWMWHQDVMDVDYDAELASWFGSWGLPPGNVGVPVVDAAMGGLGAVMEPIGPDDLLFPDDEMPSPKNSYDEDVMDESPPLVLSYPEPGPSENASMPLESPFAKGPIQVVDTRKYELDLNDAETLRLYDEVLLLSRKGCSGEQLHFDDCGDTRESILHLLAMRFKLDYGYNPGSRRVVIKYPTSLTKQEIMSRCEQSITIICPAPGADVSSDQPDRDSLRTVTQTNTPRRLAKEKPQSIRKASLQGAEQSTAPLPPSPAPGTMDLVPTSPRPATPSSSSAFGAPLDREQLRQAFLDNQVGQSISNRISSWNFFHSGISSRRPRGRRGPLSEKSRKEIRVLEGAGGACWRCRILRRKCDAGDPCKSCPAPHLREDAPPWPLIGCRRGGLRDAMPAPILCPNSSGQPAESATWPSFAEEPERPSSSSSGSRGQPDIIAQCFREAEMQRLSDSKLVLENASLYLRSRGNSPAAGYFSRVLRTGRYRANPSLNRTCRIQDRDTTLSELLADVAWELSDVRDCLTALEIESVDSFMLLLETATMYEAEIGKSSMVVLSIVCLKHCLNALRLGAANLLAAEFHNSCRPDQCAIDCLRDLSRHIYAYIEELAVMMFKKVNLRDRRWWLSTFYSLCIQSYVRRALLVVEQQLRPTSADDADLNSSHYLHLITVLFIAVSFQYDPLSVGRLQQTLVDEAGPDSTVPELYLVSARTVCGVEMWSGEGIKSSYQFLTRMLSIGSLDFVSGPLDVVLTGGGTPAPTPFPRQMSLLPETSPVQFSSPTPSSESPPSGRPETIRSFETIFSTPNSSLVSLGKSSIWTQDTGITVPPCGSAAGKRSSIGSVLSFVPPPSSTKVGLSSQSSPLPSDLPARLPLLPPPPHRKSLSVTGPAAAAGLVCGCCPKKPQTFGTSEELKAHEAKKPHICAFCGRRFSRMNEAERHINTIHLRPFSWSCAKLGSPLSAFQRITAGQDVFDVCGFCGREFKRSEGGEVPTEADSDRLVVHAQVDHKMGECNAAKKFYREDLFGQHLKASHAAEPGVWMKSLENACKTEEKPLG